MTDTPAAHLSPDRLADLDEGLLTAQDIAVAEAHLRTCGRCRTTQAAVASVPRLLASAALAPIPSDIAARLDAALAVATKQRADETAVGSRAAPDGATVTALGARRRGAASARMRKAGAALVGVAAVLGGGFLFTQDIPALSGADDAPSAGLEEGAAPGAATDGDVAASASGNDDGAVTTESRTAYSAASLVDQVTELIGTRGEAPQTLSTAREQPAPSDASLTAAEDTATCVAAVAAEARSTAKPLAVDIGSYEGDPAVVVVLPLPRTTAAAADIWVVSADCLAGDRPRLDVLRRVPTASLPSLD